MNHKSPRKSRGNGPSAANMPLSSNGRTLAFQAGNEGSEPSSGILRFLSPRNKRKMSTAVTHSGIYRGSWRTTLR